MAENVIQLWDERLIYVYALLSGQTTLTDKEIAQNILRLTNRTGNVVYCTDILAKLEADKKIELVNLRLNLKSWHDHVKENPKLLRPFANHEMSERIIHSVPHEDYESIPSLALFKQSKYNSDASRDSLHFDIQIKDQKGIINHLNSYLDTIRNNQIFMPQGENLLTYSNQKEILLRHLSKTKRGEISLPRLLNNNVATLEVLLHLVSENAIKINKLEPPQSHTFTPVKFTAHIELISEPKVARDDASKIDDEDGKLWRMKVLVEDNGQVYISIEGYEPFIIKSLSLDGAFYGFMNYVYKHSGEPIDRQRLIDYVSAIHDTPSHRITELARNSGFDSVLKDYFFRGTTSQAVVFTKQKDIITEERAGLVEHIKKLQIERKLVSQVNRRQS
jgi:hypothetical protein